MALGKLGPALGRAPCDHCGRARAQVSRKSERRAYISISGAGRRSASKEILVRMLLPCDGVVSGGRGAGIGMAD